jgi:predicted dehydrogenase
MRFAILGTHPDGLELASALVESGRHQLACFSGNIDDTFLGRWGSPRRVHDLEEVLADPAVEAVIVASDIHDRPAHLRRALQSERHVFCVHPADQKPDAAYEAAMIQSDTKQLLFPILPWGRHPALQRLRDFVASPPHPDIGSPRLLDLEVAATGEVLLETSEAGVAPGLPVWGLLRGLGGEVLEVFGFAQTDELRAGEPVVLAGHCEHGGLFQVRLLPQQSEPSWRLTVIGTRGRAELLFPVGMPGPALLTWRTAQGEWKQETWEFWDPWPVLVNDLEAVLAGKPAAVTWQDAVRFLELDDATRRSIERRRSSVMEYQEATEEAGFKGTMTLIGCSIIWVSILLLVLSRWAPWLGWLILPAIGVFLVLQVFRWAVPAPPKSGASDRTPPPPGD